MTFERGLGIVFIILLFHLYCLSKSYNINKELKAKLNYAIIVQPSWLCIV